MAASIPRDDEREGSEWSKEGTLLHLHLADPLLDRSGLKIAQAETLSLTESMIRDVVASVSRDVDICESSQSLTLREHSMPFKGASGQEMFRGTTDALMTWPGERVSLVLDAKFGHQTVTPAEGNLQLAAYCVMAYDENPVERVYAAIIQPRAPYGERMTMAVYISEAMAGLKREILTIIHDSEQPDAPLHASPSACQYCRAKEVCPAYREQFQVVATTSLESMLALPAEEFARIGDAIKLGAMLSKAWSAEAVRRIEAGEMSGWKLKDNGRTSEITDILAAYSRFLQFRSDTLADASSCAKEFLACMSPKWGKLEALVAGILKVSSKKARAKINELFAGLIEHEEQAKSPVRGEAK